MQNQVQYVQLQNRPIDPNRAKYWSIGLAAVACLFALVTIKSNYDYFAAYYDGWSFWLRVIPFMTFEATIIGLTLTKGWGNPRQMTAALVFEVALVAVGLLHTYYVSGATQTRIAAERSKAAAKADFAATSAAAAAAAETNARLQGEYNRALANWRRAAADAAYLRRPVPAAPQPPQLVAIPQVDQATVATAATDVEGRVEAEAPHKFLTFLLYVLIALVVGAWTSIVFLADSSRLRYWLLRERGRDLDREMRREREVVALGQEPFQRLLEELRARQSPTPAAPPRSIGLAPQAKTQEQERRPD